MISTKNLQQAKNQIKTTKGRPIIVKAQDSEFNRKILEYGKFDVLLDVHDTRGIDRLRQLDSGLNHVIARIAAKNEVAIGIDLERIRNLNGKMKAEFLGRIRQNIKICRKAKVKIRLVNFIDDLDAKDFLVSLGASTSQASGAIWRMKKDAVISKCGKYRYLLTRAWDSSKPGMLYIGLNPSTADDKKDDPTIRRAIQYAKDWGFGSLSVCNLFAFRATLPSDLKKAKDPVGKENDLWLMRESLRAEKIVAGWGNHGSFLNRSFEVRNLLGRLNHLGLTKTGEPKHPLYLRKDLKPIGFV